MIADFAIPPVGQRLRTVDGEQEKWCRRCAEWLPATAEYFYRSRLEEGGLYYCCKACYSEWLSPRRPAGTRRAAP